jgi:peptidoglycan/LPS O-acetylase OafA/YrhL
LAAGTFFGVLCVKLEEVSRAEIRTGRRGHAILENSVDELKDRTPAGRSLELDGLRGLAAFTVVWHHFWTMFDLHQQWWQLPLVSGKQAVILFFLLSGFVLSLPFWKSNYRFHYGSFLIRRFFRIYVPYAGVVFLSAALARWLGGSPLNLSPFFNVTWHAPVTASLVVRHLLGAPNRDLNNAFWTLQIEMEMSILFPLVVLLLRRLPVKICLPLMFIVMVVASRLTIGATSWFTPGFVFLQFACMFVIGAALAQNREASHRLWQKMHVTWRWVFFVTSLLCYWGFGDMLIKLIRPNGIPILMNVLGGLGLLICGMNLRRFRDVLRTRPPEYLGRVSYSMYLLHEPMLYALTILLFGLVSLPVIAAAYLVSVMVVARLYCVGIEEPSLRIGKKLSMKFGGRV